jgi:hypothetical protein
MEVAGGRAHTRENASRPNPLPGPDRLLDIDGSRPLMCVRERERPVHDAAWVTKLNTPGGMVNHHKSWIRDKDERKIIGKQTPSSRPGRNRKR